MEKYSEYIDSGAHWLGMIPSHWDCQRSRYLLLLQSNCSCRPNKIGLENIESFTGRYLPTETIFDGNGTDFDKGDIVYGKLRPYLCKVWVAEFDGNAVGDFYVYRVSGVYCTDFAKYLMLSNPFTDICNASTYGAKMPRVAHQFIASLGLPVPPLTEQQAIVSYLDDKCAKLDQLVTNKEKEIELLQEMKQRVIADAVTRGLNPDVKFKDTDISWLPQIPEHWSSAKLKAFCKDNKEKNKGNFESKVLSLSYGRVIIKQNINFGLVPDSYETYQIVNPGYIILRLTDLQNDHKSLRTGLVKDRGIITSAYVALIVNNMDSTYVQHVLHSYDIMKVFYGMGGGLRQSMSYQDIANLYIPIPPIDEQKAIVAYIEERVTKIDTLAQKLQQEIDSIKEYKQRLISDVVTGQIKVC